MGLFGEEFNVTSIAKEKEQKAIAKLTNKKKAASKKSVNIDKMSLPDQLRVIRQEVNKVLGTVYADQVGLIETREQLHDYIDKCIANGEIAIDTETNRSLDPITCLLMGGCIYTPGELAMYIPVNHCHPGTDDKLENQCTEADVKAEFDRLEPNGVKVIMHNADFDYRVIRCTTGCDLPIYWDTMIGSRILNELELASLKGQYMDKIDSSIGKYSIDSFFKNIEYKDVDPSTFALYAATDALITYRLFKWQEEQFAKPENEPLNEIFHKVEMPLIKVVSNMELEGIQIDKEYAKRLEEYYQKDMIEADKRIMEELTKLKPLIDNWRLSPAANAHPLKNDKPTKSLNEKLEEPPAVTSPSQLAILMYDVLKFPPVNRDKPRSTGADDLKTIVQKYKFPLGDAILAKRGLEKLLSTYVIKIPAETHADGRIRADIKQLGADTGRFSIKNPSLQNIPSHAKEVRLMFSAGYSNTQCNFDDELVISKYDELPTVDGWIKAPEIVPGVQLKLNDGSIFTVAECQLDEQGVHIQGGDLGEVNNN